MSLRTLRSRGTFPVHFKAALAKGQGKNFQLNALLVDVADEDFDVVGNGSVKQDKTADGFWMGKQFKQLIYSRIRNHQDQVQGDHKRLDQPG